MLTREENTLLTQVGPGTPLGETMRRYWMPALVAWELPEPDCPPVRVSLLGERLVAFRDTAGKIGRGLDTQLTRRSGVPHLHHA